MKVLRIVFVPVLFFAMYPMASLMAAGPTSISLPTPRNDGKVSLEKALKKRRALRVFSEKPLTLGEVGQLCWAAQGVTDDKGHRTAPSAKALYPLELYVIAVSVKGLAPGLYHYAPEGHSLVLAAAGNLRDELVDKAVNQDWIHKAPVIFVVSGKAGKMASMGKRGEQFMNIEAGLAAQNLLLQATALGLGGNFVGGFDPPKVRAVLGLSNEEEVLAVLPIGNKP